MGPKKKQKLSCLFCLKGIEIKEGEKVSGGLFNSCVRYLSEDIFSTSKNEWSWEEFKENNGPFCSICFKSAQDLSMKNELVELLETEMTQFVNCLTMSILENRKAEVNTCFEYVSDISILITRLSSPQGDIFEESEVLDLNSDNPLENYEENLQEIEIEENLQAIEFEETPREEIGEKSEEIEVEVFQDLIQIERNSPGKKLLFEKKDLLPISSRETASTDNSKRKELKLKKIVLQKSSEGKIMLTLPCECGLTFEDSETFSKHKINCKINENGGEKANAEGGSKMKAEIRYRCGTCGLLAPSLAALETHKKKHVKKIRKCYKCGATFTLQADHREHMRNHRRMSQLCPTCGRTFESQTALSAHIEKGIHDEAEESKSEWNGGRRKRQCDICGKVFGSKAHLNYHTRTSHCDEMPFQCTVCKRRFKIRRFLHVHEQTHKKVKDYLCAEDRCGKSFPTLAYFKRHMRLEHSDNHFKCLLCDFKTLVSKKLDLHKTRFHDARKKFECPICLIRVSSRNTLENHQRIHTGEKPFKCSECHESFRTRILLKSHRNVNHVTENKLQCPHCDYVAGTNYVLKCHLLVHSDDKPFKCDACGNSYKASGTLLSHVRITCKVLHKKS